MKLDLGCGTKKREGFVGVDCIAFDGVDFVFDMGSVPWTFADSSVDEAHASHVVEHLTAGERCHFYNELYRVLKPGAQATIIVPHWGSNRAYGDPTHQWPPVSEMSFFYLDRTWREREAPHTDAKHWPGGYACDFTATWGYSLHPAIQTRNQEFQSFAISFYKEAALDMHATLTARK